MIYGLQYILYLLSPSIALLYPLPLITSRNKKEERRGEAKNPFLRSNRETAVLYDGCSERTGRMNDIA